MSFKKAHYDFSGQIAVVTGGSNGIGAQIADNLRNAGATVCIWDLAVDDNEGNSSSLDITNLESVRLAAQQVHERHGRVDLLVNSVGFSGPTMPLSSYDPGTWEHVISVNLMSIFNVCHEIVPYMQRSGAGRIVNMASLAGKEGTPNASAYSAAKAGVLALTKSLGKELASSGVFVNAVAPAAVHTSLLAQMTEEHVQTMIDKSPMQRLGEPQEVAELTLWLCSDSCTFSTGAVFDLSGGRSTY